MEREMVRSIGAGGTRYKKVEGFMIHGLIYICPECRKTLLFTPNDNGTLYLQDTICSSDGYKMKLIRLDSLMIDRLLKDTVANAS